MLLAFVVSNGIAGQLIGVERNDDGGAFRVIGTTTDPVDQVVTWQGRPLDLLIIADLSVSIVVDPTGPADEMREAMLAAYHAMREHPVPGDRLGVTVFGDDAQRWVPLGGLDRTGLDTWLATFGPQPHAPLPYATATPLDVGEWRTEPTLATDLGVDAFRTDPSTGVRTALEDLRGPSSALKVAVVLWDGEQTTESCYRKLLNRAWRNHEVHVFTIAVGDVHDEGLASRGGGDVYLAGGAADLAMRRIVGQLRMPEE
jgi:hypothetical protein